MKKLVIDQYNDFAHAEILDNSGNILEYKLNETKENIFNFVDHMKEKYTIEKAILQIHHSGKVMISEFTKGQF